MLAKAAASLDVLTSGRLQLGLGAGAFWEAVEAMGEPHRTKREAVDALDEAITVIRGMWSTERSLRFTGRHYRVAGVRPGPRPSPGMGGRPPRPRGPPRPGALTEQRSAPAEPSRRGRCGAGHRGYPRPSAVGHQGLEP